MRAQQVCHRNACRIFPRARQPGPRRIRYGTKQNTNSTFPRGRHVIRIMGFSRENGDETKTTKSRLCVDPTSVALQELRLKQRGRRKCWAALLAMTKYLIRACAHRFVSVFRFYFNTFIYVHRNVIIIKPWAHFIRQMKLQTRSLFSETFREVELTKSHVRVSSGLNKKR